jgi:DNA-binding NarL/FixJ family response regulator
MTAVAARSSPTPNAALQAYLVEDNVLVRDNLIAALEELAPLHFVGTAADESVALQWLSADGEACDLVIVDIFLRSGSGLGVIAAARRRLPQAALVVLSNYATDEMRARCLAGGADRVFDKSRDIDVLVAYCTALALRNAGKAAH